MYQVLARVLALIICIHCTILAIILAMIFLWVLRWPMTRSVKNLIIHARILATVFRNVARILHEFIGLM